MNGYARTDAFYGAANASTPIAMNYVSCTGSEEGLLECDRGEVTDACKHSKDAGVKCTEGDL